MAKVHLRPDLDEVIARLIQPAVDDRIEDVAKVARSLAPPTKTWLTVSTAPCSHCRRAHGQERPANLRFALKSYQWDMEHRGVGPMSYLLAPRDHSSRAYVMAHHCKCRTGIDPDGIAKLIEVVRSTRVGTVVAGKVRAEGNLVVEAEFGDVYPPGSIVAEGTYFMHRTVAVVAARYAAL